MDVGSQKKLVTVSFVSPGQHRGFQQGLKSGDEHEFRQGLLLESIEKGVKYPAIHFGTVNYYFGWEQKSKFLKDNSTVEQGLYEELAAVHVDLFGTALTNVRHGLNGAPVTWGKFYLVLGFKQLPFRAFSDLTEVHWKDWSLARYFFLNMPDDFGLSGLTFYKRDQPDDFSLFLYMVVVECAHVLPRDQLKLNDFVSRIRADKLPSYMALYQTSGDKLPTSMPLPSRFTTKTTVDVDDFRAHHTPVMESVQVIRTSSPSPVRHQRPGGTQTRGTSPLGHPWFFMSHPQFLRRSQRHLNRSGDLDSVGDSDGRSSSMSYSTEGRSTSVSPAHTPLPYHYQWPRVHFDEY